jgi:hypothetical protein
MRSVLYKVKDASKFGRSVIMWIDPIVQEVRAACEELAKKANYDLHTFIENLKENEKKLNSKIVSRIDLKTVEPDETKPCLMCNW